MVLPHTPLRLWVCGQPVCFLEQFIKNLVYGLDCWVGNALGPRDATLALLLAWGEMELAQTLSWEKWSVLFQGVRVPLSV